MYGHLSISGIREWLTCNKAVRLNPYDSEAYYNRGAALAAIGYFDLAIADFNRAIQLDPFFMDAYQEWGYAFYDNLGADEGDYDEAADSILENAFPYDSHGITLTEWRVEPIRASLDYNNLGLTYAYDWEFYHAISCFDIAIKNDPGQAYLYGNRGLAFLMAGEYDRAIADFNRVLELNPRDSSAYYYRGHACSVSGKIEIAVSDLEKALELGLPPFWEKLARYKLAELRSRG